VTVTASTGASDTAAWPVDSGTDARRSHVVVEASYGRQAVAAIGDELEALAVSCDAPLTARPAWSLVPGTSSDYLRPWALLARDAAGTPVGALVLLDHVHDPRAVLTTLAGTDGGHRGAILTRDTTVALALGDALQGILDRQPTAPTVVLGPLPAGSPVVDAFSAGMYGSRQDPAAAIPVVRRSAGTEPDDYLAAGMRRTLRKSANRLATDGREAQTRFTSEATEILGSLRKLEYVHRNRDHMHGRISDLDDAVRHGAWRDRAQNLTDVGLLELATLHIDGELAAYTLGVVDGPVYRLLEGRFVTEWARYSPGRLLEAAVVQRFLDDDALTTFDWMTSVAPESLLGRNDEDPMVLVQLG
jgi:Acetyltransferase (GNAT) domain